MTDQNKKTQGNQYSDRRYRGYDAQIQLSLRLFQGIYIQQSFSSPGWAFPVL